MSTVEKCLRADLNWASASRYNPRLERNGTGTCLDFIKIFQRKLFFSVIAFIIG